MIANCVQAVRLLSTSLPRVSAPVHQRFTKREEQRQYQYLDIEIT